MIKTYRELIVWQKSMRLVSAIYKITKNFPKNEEFSLSSQLRRAVISMPSNIAEGFGRKTPKEFSRFLYIAIGSLFEVQTQIDISLDQEYIINDTHKDIFDKSREIERMICSLIKKIKNNEKKWQSDKDTK